MHLRSRKRRHPNWPIRFIFLGLFATFLIYVIALPVLQFRADAGALESNRWIDLQEKMLTQGMTWFVIVWTFFFGACLGSFLNVVAYRVPNGLTLLGSSRCPYCYVSIQSQHNLPILGWFRLRGRCASCRLPISPRYFLVEITAGILLVWVMTFELMGNGSNLPSNQEYSIGKFARTLSSGKIKPLFQEDWSLVRIAALHCLIGYTLLTAGLMRLDRLRIPIVWALIHVLCTVAFIFVYSDDFAFAAWSPGSQTRTSTIASFVDPVLIGGIVGGLIGGFFQRITGKKQTGLIFAGILLGAGLGIQGIISTSLVFLALSLTVGLFRWGRVVLQNPLLLFFTAFLLQLAFWNSLNRVLFLSADSDSWWQLIPITILVAGGIGLAAFYQRLENSVGRVTDG